MANKEMNFAEKTGDTLKRAGIVGAMIGLIAMLASIKIGETLFWGSAAIGATGAVGKKLAGSGEKK